MGGEQSRPGTQRIPPPAVIPAHAAAPGRLYCTPEDMLHLMAGGGALGGSPFLPPGSGGGLAGGGAVAQMVHAQQMRCDAVVAPHTLALAADPADPSRLHLSFDFSSHAPVEAAVAYLCICRRSPSDAAPLPLLSRLPRSPLRHCFPAGPRHHFSQSALAQGAATWGIVPQAGGSSEGSSSSSSSGGGGDGGASLQGLEGGLDLARVTMRELCHRPSAFAGCGDLLPPLPAGAAAAAAAAAAPPSRRPAAPLPQPPPSSRLGAALDAPALAALEVPADMCPLLVTLTVLDAEGRPAVPTRLQATLCSIVPDSSAASGWKVCVLLQLFQAGAQVYKTQTLFGDSDGSGGGGGSSSGGSGGGGGSGGSSGPAAGGAGGAGAALAAAAAQGSASAAVDEGLITGSDCVICLCEPRTTALLPCRHLCLCAPCAQQLRFQSNRCPICRSPTTSLLTWGH